MSNLVSTVSAQIAGPLVDLLCALAVAGIAAATRLLIAHTTNLRVQGILTRLDTASEAAVRQVAQTEADALKAAATNNKLTPEQAKAASLRALEIVKANLGDKGLADIKKILGVDDVAALIATHNEAAVHRISADGVPSILSENLAVAAPPAVAAVAASASPAPEAAPSA